MADKVKAKANNENSRKSYPRGLIEGLPLLHYDERANMGLRVQHFCEKLMIHTRSSDLYIDLDNIFKAENPSFPDIKPPDEPKPKEGEEDISKYAEIRYTKEYDMYLKNGVRLECDKVRLHGIIVGQLSETSKNQVKTTSEGITALEEDKDPLKLIKAVRATHLTHSLVDPKIAFFAAQSLYEQTRMDDRDSLARHKEVLEAAHSRLCSAAVAAEASYEGETFDVPSESMLAVKFVMTLSTRYGAYKQKVTRGEKDIPRTIKDALEDVQKHGPEYAQGVRNQQERINVNIAKGKANAGRSEGGARRKLVPGVDGKIIENIKCLFRGCGEYGHMAKMCPLKSAKRAEQMSEDEKSIEKSVSFVAEEFKKVGKGGLKAGGGSAGSN
jgi:hypothetical protein